MAKITGRTLFETLLLNTMDHMVAYYKASHSDCTDGEKKLYLSCWENAFKVTLEQVKTSAELSAIEHACPPSGTGAFTQFALKAAELRK